jgi:hypothetical protein
MNNWRYERMRERKVGKKVLAIGMVLVLVAMVFAALPMNVGAGSGNGCKQVPFKGNFDGSTVPRLSEEPDLERYEVSGQASHLGKYTAVIKADLDLIQVPIGFDNATGLPIGRLPLLTATFTAANGDKLYANIILEGLFHPVNQNFPFFTLDATITGGTGRFDGATGCFSAVGGQTSVPGDDNDLMSGTFK